MHASQKHKTAEGEVRIIGGEWRGRKIRFPLLPGVRPSGNRFRETLFNWLTPWINGANCLDLFAGSGALGLEALSRGAARATFLDNSQVMTVKLQNTIDQLKAQGADVVYTDAFRWLSVPQSCQSFDIAFADPPFHQGLLLPTLSHLARRGILANSALIYFEAERNLPLPALPAGWTIHRHKTGGQVQYGLLQTMPDSSATWS